MADGRARQRDPMRRFEVLAGKGGPPWLAGGAPRPWRGFGFPWYRKEKQKRIQGKEERGFREKKNGGRTMAGLLGACHTI